MSRAAARRYNANGPQPPMTDDQDARLKVVTRRFLIASIALGAASPSVLAEANAVGTVADLTGNAVAQSGTTGRPLSRQAPIYLEDIVRTQMASRLSLQLGARTELRLGEETEIKIDRYVVDAGGLIEFKSGVLAFDRTGPRANEELQFNSSYCLIGVRGTRFFAGPSQGAFGVLVGNGTVSVSGGGKTVIVGPQQGTTISAPGARPTSPKAWALSRIQDIQRRVR
jgi:FecR-like protein